ncbi:hypothetical protein BTO09_13795 [Gilvibacter sp. SZ-19]|nr:hypothetical protein BTO09_13795 [Gilvibacter sp. SZ-19]
MVFQKKRFSKKVSWVMISAHIILLFMFVFFTAPNYSGMNVNFMTHHFTILSALLFMIYYRYQVITQANNA